jgi:hypothetical protein
VCGPSKCLQNPAVGHALVQLKSDSGYDVYIRLSLACGKVEHHYRRNESNEDPVAGGLRLIKALVSCLTEDMG